MGFIPRSRRLSISLTSRSRLPPDKAREKLERPLTGACVKHDGGTERERHTTGNWEQAQRTIHALVVQPSAPSFPPKYSGGATYCTTPTSLCTFTRASRANPVRERSSGKTKRKRNPCAQLLRVRRSTFSAPHTTHHLSPSLSFMANLDPVVYGLNLDLIRVAINAKQ